ncbi:MAG: type I-E CRISPR-associated protein Cas5/CasD, partial [Candidatus Aegiribacteria sp.]|nr:type I-E CRISPR-associated protein Cas5/CasD [Candidatus Aegiribacteria sp.]
PLMSFGAPMVDNIGRTERVPSLSAITGLLANALGYDHRDADSLTRLQSRLKFAVRCDRPGNELRDFQTVDLGQDFLDSSYAWTTWGRLDGRKGGRSAKKGTHIRYRDYLADAVYTVSVGLRDEEENPDISAIESALIHPMRPLFIGRKCCIPSSPILIGSMNADSPLGVLQLVPPITGSRRSSAIERGLSVWWFPFDGGHHKGPYREFRVTDQRDWHNQIHSGYRILRHGLLHVRGDNDG